MMRRTASRFLRFAPTFAVRPQALALARSRACGPLLAPSRRGLGVPLGRTLCSADGGASIDGATIANPHIMPADEVRRMLELEKGRDIFVLDMQGMHGGRLGETLVIVTGTNRRHLLHLAETVRAAARASAPDGTVLSIEDEQSDDWMLLDLGSVVVHFMSEHGRAYYDLDSLWTANVARHAEAQREAAARGAASRRIDT